MADTYLTLKNRVLAFCDLTGSTDAGTVVQNALEETMKYISMRVELPQLIKSATATYSAATGYIPLSSFSTVNFDTPNRMYKRSATATSIPGTPYDYLEWMHWLDLQNIPFGYVRDSIFSTPRTDQRPRYAWTLDTSNNLYCYPAQDGDIVTLYYNTTPAAYSDSGIPEIPNGFTYILVNGATTILKDWVREPDQVSNPHGLLAAIDPQIELLDSKINSNRKRGSLRLTSRYRVR